MTKEATIAMEAVVAAAAAEAVVVMVAATATATAVPPAIGGTSKATISALENREFNFQQAYGNNLKDKRIHKHNIYNTHSTQQIQMNPH